MDITKLSDSYWATFRFGENCSLVFEVFAPFIEKDTQEEFDSAITVGCDSNKRNDMESISFSECLTLWGFLGNLLSQIKVSDDFANNCRLKKLHEKLCKAFKQEESNGLLG